MVQSRLLLLLVGGLIVLGLPLLGTWARRRQQPRCALDGLTIDPLFRVRSVDAAGDARCFCCVRCARQWLARHVDEAHTVYVTDEASGAEIDAAAAFFVQSSVLAQPITGNRVHVFRAQADAESHARMFAGAILTDADRPFGRSQR